MRKEEMVRARNQKKTDHENEDPFEVQIANLFYEAEDLKRDDPKEALTKFLKVVELAKDKKQHQHLEDETKTSVFKSMQHITVLLWESKRAPEMIQHYKSLLEFIPNVTRNEGAEAIDSVLMAINDSKDFKLQEQIYAVTSDALAKMPDSERMLFDVRMKLCRAYINRNAYDEASEVLVGLHKSCQTSDGQDDKKTKGSELLEIYSLQLMISAAQGDNVRLKELFEKTKDLTAAVKDPRSQSIIRECWGMMFGDEGQWQRAKAEFFSAFVSYDEIGNAVKAKQCLKYVVVSNMLSGSDANPFDDRAAKVYENDKEIALIGQLRIAFEKCDVNAFSRCLDEINKAKDHFIQKHLESMVNDFRARSIISMIKSYRRIRITHLAERLRVTPDQIEEILIHLILDGSVLGKIDQVKGMLDLTQRTGGGAKKYGALDVWAGTLSSLASNLPQPASSL